MELISQTKTLLANQIFYEDHQVSSKVEYLADIYVSELNNVFKNFLTIRPKKVITNFANILAKIVKVKFRSKKMANNTIEVVKKNRDKSRTDLNEQRKVVRFQFEVSPTLWESLEEFQRIAEIPTKRELINNALTLFKWAMKQKLQGKSIMAVDDNSSIELELPCFDVLESKVRSPVKLVG